MAVHRYWRVSVLSNWGGSQLGISDIRLRATQGGANLSTPGNGTATGDNTPSYAFDGEVDGAGNWYSPVGPTYPVNLGWDFGAGNEKDILSFDIYNSVSSLTMMPKSVRLLYSDDNVNWTLWMVGENQYGSLLVTTFNWAPFGAGTASISSPLPVVAGYGGGSASVTPASSVVQAYGGASSNLAAASPTLQSFGGANLSLTGTFPTLLSTGRSSAGDNDFTYTAPSALLSARGGVNARLTAPSATLTTTATVTNWGKSGITAPSATLSVSGTVSGTGHANLTFNDPYKIVGYSGAVCSITLTGSPTIQAQSTAGSIGGAAITCPLFELSSSGTARNYGSASLLAPAARLGAQAQAWLAAPGFQLTAIGSATITATYEAYAVNLLHRNTDAPVDEATRYTNFPFTHIVRYRNSYYGANSTGLYLLEGTTDDGTPIPWEFKTAITDFESPMVKTVASAYFAGRMGPEATVSVYLGESGDVSYSHSTPRGAAAQNYRQVFGKGLKDRYYALSVAGEGVMELDALELNTKTLTRRI